MLDGPPQNSPNASRGSSLRLDEAAFKRQVDLAGVCPIPGWRCVGRCLGSGLGRAGRGRGGGNGGDFVLLYSNLLAGCEELTQRRRDSLRNAEKREGRRSSPLRSSAPSASLRLCVKADLISVARLAGDNFQNPGSASSLRPAE